MIIEVAGNPAQKGSFVPIRNRRSTHLQDADPSLPYWNRILEFAARKVAPATPITNPVEVSIKHFLPRNGSTERYPTLIKDGDIDKQLRADLDAMTGLVYVDDSQVVRATIEQCYADSREPGAIIEVNRI